MTRQKTPEQLRAEDDRGLFELTASPDDRLPKFTPIKLDTTMIPLQRITRAYLAIAAWRVHARREGFAMPDRPRLRMNADHAMRLMESALQKHSVSPNLEDLAKFLGVEEIVIENDTVADRDTLFDVTYTRTRRTGDTAGTVTFRLHG